MRLFKAKCWENLRHHQWSSHPQCHITLQVTVSQGQDSSELIALLHLISHEARVLCLRHPLGERWLPTIDITTGDYHHICWEDDWKALVIEKTDNNQASGIPIVYEWLVSIKNISEWYQIRVWLLSISCMKFLGHFHRSATWHLRHTAQGPAVPLDLHLQVIEYF